jgi:hypothetical protein
MKGEKLMSAMDRTILIEKAERIVNQDRNTRYGGPEESFTTIARFWSVFLGTEISPLQVAGCMILLKLARLKKTPTHEDSVVDGIGYFACMADFLREPSSVVDSEQESKLKDLIEEYEKGRKVPDNSSIQNGGY